MATATKGREYTVRLRRPHAKQRQFIDCKAKRLVLRSGRRFGKTTGVAILAIKAFLKGRRVLYATPTQEQIDRFWHEVKNALAEPIAAGVFYKNETRHIIEIPGTENRIRAKTAYNADTLRGDYADLLILDEYQMMDEDTWGLVGAPMLLDNDGDAVFIFTKKRGKHHSDDLFNKAKEDDTARWEAFTFSSLDNPHLSREALAEITTDMTQLAYRAEILAEDIGDDPRALWTREIIDHVNKHPDLDRIVVAVDPQASTGQTGIIVLGAAYLNGMWHGYVLEDATPPAGASPSVWGSAVVTAYHKHQADKVIGEVNNGGDMIEHVIRSVPEGKEIAYEVVRATRGKAVRAEPVAAVYEDGRGHHVGNFNDLEDELTNWVAGESNWSPNRLDALVWGYHAIVLGGVAETQVVIVGRR